MMKKWKTLVIAIPLALTMASCGSATDTSSTAVTTTAGSTAAATTTADSAVAATTDAETLAEDTELTETDEQMETSGLTETDTEMETSGLTETDTEMETSELTETDTEIETSELAETDAQTETDETETAAQAETSEEGTIIDDSAETASDASAEDVSAEDASGGRMGNSNSSFGGGNGNGNSGTLDKSWDTELTAMLEEAEASFTQDTYTDESTGLSVPYNIFVPDGYAGDGTAPIIFFIGDATTAGNTMEYSIEQGWGGIVWATDAVQSVEQCIVVVPVFPEVVIDDNSGSYETTDYLELIPDMITSITEKYGADPDRIYGTGQSMGAMATLYTAAQNPDLYSAVLIVDGQWDITTLQGIEEVNFIYVTSAGDDKATEGQDEVKAMLEEDGVDYAEVYDLDASLMDDSDTRSEIEDAVSAMLDEGSDHNFITWTSGSVLTSYGGSGSEHMAAFDYGYKLECVRDWILSH